MQLTVPANWSAPQKTTSNAAGYVTATSGGSAVAVGNITIAGSGPWTIDITVPSALNSGQTVVVTYGDTSINAGGAAAAPGPGNAGNAVFTIKEKSTSGGTLTTVAGTQTVAVNNSADGAGTGTIAPTSTLAGTANNTETATYTATTGGIAANGVVELTIPANWSAPQKTTSNAAGYVTATAGGSAVAAGNIAIAGSGPWTIDVTLASALSSGQTVVFTYGDTSVNAGGAAAAPGPGNAGNSVFTIKEKTTSGGTLTGVAGSQTVAVSNSADGAGTGTIAPTSTLAGTTNNTETATYTATTGGLAANGVVELTVPANWTAPQKTTSNAAGYVTATAGGSAVAAGNIAIAGSGPWTIDVTLASALSSGQTVVVTYGDTSVNVGGAAAAPSAANAGNSTFTIKEKSTSAGSLTTVAGAQTVAVSNSADGSGTGAVLPISTFAGTTNNTEVATYTATTGGVAANGVVEVTVPANWSAPQKTTSNAAGYVTATSGGSAVAAGNIAIAGSGPWTIDITVPSALNSGQTVVITYGDTSINAGGAAAAPSAANAGNSVFTVKEKSTSGGTLTTVGVGGGTQTVAVNNSADGAGTGTIAPTSTLAGTTNNTETATYTATTGGLGANGVVQLTVPANWSAPQKTTNNAAGYVTATAGGSAVAVGNIAIAGSGPWTIDITVPSAPRLRADRRHHLRRHQHQRRRRRRGTERGERRKLDVHDQGEVDERRHARPPSPARRRSPSRTPPTAPAPARSPPPRPWQAPRTTPRPRRTPQRRAVSPRTASCS